MKRAIWAVTLTTLVLASRINTQAVTISDNFDNGISSFWDVFDSSAAGVPWTVDTLVDKGQLWISKPADNEPCWCPVAGVRSKYRLVGNFSTSIDFELINFPSGDFYSNNIAKGYNWAFLKIATSQSVNIWDDTSFASVRGSTDVKGELGGIEGYACTNSLTYNIGLTRDEVMSGRLGITRQGQMMSVYLDRGNGLESLGTFSSTNFDAPVYIQLAAAQVPYSADRPHTSLDVRYDNFIVTADSIIGIPEPTSLFLLVLGCLRLLRRR